MIKEIGLNVLAFRPASMVWASRRFQALTRLGLLFFFVYGGFFLRAQAQEDAFYEIRNYTTEDGLSSNHVYQTFQDSRGLIWVVTGNGIDLFDGVQFEQVMQWEFSSVAYNNRICFEDEQGILWVKVAREDRLQLRWMNAKTKEELLQPPPLFQKWNGDCVDIAAGPAGSLLLLDRQGRLWKVREEADPELLYTSNWIESSFCSHTRNDSVIWLYNKGTRERKSDYFLLYTVIFEDKQVMEYVATDVSHRPFVLPNGTLLTVGKTDYAKIIPGQRATYQAIAGAIPRYQVDLRDNNNFSYNPETEEIWILNQAALIVFKYNGGLVHDFSKDKNTNGPKISFDLFLDKQGILWVGAIGGIFKIVRTSTKFKRLVWKSPVEDSEIQERPCRGMLVHSDGRVYFNASLETYAMTPKLQGLKVVSKDLLGYYALSEELDGRLINALSSFYHLDPVTGKKIYYELPKSKGLANIWSVLPQQDRIWLGNNKGILYFDRREKVIKEFDQYNGYESLRISEVYQMLSKEHGRVIWMVSSTGIYVVDVEKGVVGRYWTGATGASYLPADNIRHIYVSSTGAYWLATSIGLLFWDPVLGITQYYGEKEGLINTNSYAVYPDRFGFIWFSTDAGIGQLDYVTGKVRFYQTKDGVTHNEFNRISHLQLPDGTLLFGSMNGVTVLDPEDFQKAFSESKNGMVSLVGASMLSAANKEELDILGQILSNNCIELHPGYILLNLRFAVSDYSESTPFNYSYKIEGLHTNWIPANGNEIQLIGLPYGSYQLRVRAQNGSGTSHDQEFVLLTVVRVPFYMRLWFLLALVGLLLVAVYVVVRFRTQFLRNLKRKLEQEIALRTKEIEHDRVLIEQQALLLKQKDLQKSYFLSNLTHELRTPVTLILGPIKHLLKKGGLGQETTKSLTIAQRNAKQLLQLVNSALELLSLENHAVSVHQKPVLIETLVRDVVGEFRMLGLAKKISLHFYTEEQSALLVSVDETHVRTILSNLLSNAIKFTPSRGKVSVQLVYVEGRLQLSVRDTGRGIHPDDLPHIFERFFQTQQPDAPVEGGTGIGLSLSKDLVELMGGQIWVESTINVGTIFYVELPAVRHKNLEVVTNPTKLDGGKTYESGEEKTYPILFQLWRSAVHEKAVPTLLVVEDNQEMQQYLAQIFKSNYDAQFVGSGLEAHDYLRSNPIPDLLITDLMMPDMDGYQLVKSLRSKEHLKNIPILVLSARADIERLEYMVDDFLVKPFDEDELLDRVEVLIARNLVKLESSLYTDCENTIGVGPNLVNSEELAWLRKLESTLILNIGNTSCTAEVFAGQMLMGRTAFFQEVKRLTGLTPNQYIQEARLLEAKRLLELRVHSSFSSVVAAVGMKSESYFSLLFRQRFGVAPTSYFPKNRRG
jgi:signal transduction histidine kinase/ligand-binding sensor domain-containing protein/AraC-like DNA-binding protein